VNLTREHAKDWLYWRIGLAEQYYILDCWVCMWSTWSPFVTLLFWCGQSGRWSSYR
jgi:hypothetical protein